MHGSDERDKDRAQFTRAAILEDLGEEFLAENLLKACSFFLRKRRRVKRP